MIRFLLDEGVNPAIHPTVGELTRGEWFNPFAFFIYCPETSETVFFTDKLL